ncbi:hypothetical protein NDU88_008275 [Pleurodeles waltl]|uniref:Uncharacterized protein n=1 Tax=Pleurodeles waltl TaxID=8319 RepID=A0AAV7SUM5_PLEWA|nr:hypothetical protein NDU88_008275 [Pleurodeles waltl]
MEAQYSIQRTEEPLWACAEEEGGSAHLSKGGGPVGLCIGVMRFCPAVQAEMISSSVYSEERGDSEVLCREGWRLCPSAQMSMEALSIWPVEWEPLWVCAEEDEGSLCLSSGRRSPLWVYAEEGRGSVHLFRGEASLIAAGCVKRLRGFSFEDSGGATPSVEVVKSSNFIEISEVRLRV